MTAVEEKQLKKETGRRSSPNSDPELEAQVDPLDHHAEAATEGIKPAFMAKVGVLNQAIAEIGMGRFQYELFFTAGFGWFADNLWLQAISILMPAISNQWEGTVYVKHLSLALYAGLIVGAAFWGCSADIVGRRIAWNATLLICGIFGVAAGAAPNFVSLCVLIAFLGVGIGGNLPVDGTLFIEFIPGSHQYLLTLLSLWWAIGQVVGSLICWAFLVRWGCATPEVGQFCADADNKGWRYAFYTLGAMTLFLWVGRFFVCPVYESPKFLCSVGRDQEAVDTIHKIANRNGKTSSLTIEDLRRAAAPYLESDSESIHTAVDREDNDVKTKMTTKELIKNSFEEVNTSHVKALFSTKRLAYSTSLVITIFSSIGLAYPLYNQFLGTYLSQKQGAIGETSLNETYASFTYQAACGIPGSIVAAILVEWGKGGRKFAMALFTAAAGVFLFGLTQAKTNVQINVLTCFAAFCQNAFYGVMYGYAPEVFPTPSRGTGDALASSSNRLTGLFAPIIAIYSAARETPDGPVFASAGIYVATAVIMLMLPIETRGKTAY